MRRLILFCEDSFHEKFVGALVGRFSKDTGIGVDLMVLSARGGLPKMHGELKDFLRDLSKDRQSPPDSLIVVADANCLGYTERKRQMEDVSQRHDEFRGLISYAIPDPHIERWMLADASAFQEVFGRGCTLPAIKCAKGEYKKLLRTEIRDSGIEAPLGGEEFAEDVVMAMNLARVETHEQSFGLFLRDLKALFNAWGRPE